MLGEAFAFGYIRGLLHATDSSENIVQFHAKNYRDRNGHP
jgi:hypothetical protein